MGIDYEFWNIMTSVKPVLLLNPFSNRWQDKKRRRKNVWAVLVFVLQQKPDDVSGRDVTNSIDMCVFLGKLVTSHKRFIS